MPCLRQSWFVMARVYQVSGAAGRPWAHLACTTPSQGCSPTGVPRLMSWVMTMKAIVPAQDCTWTEARGPGAVAPARPPGDAHTHQPCSANRQMASSASSPKATGGATSISASSVTPSARAILMANWSESLR